MAEDLAAWCRTEADDWEPFGETYEEGYRSPHAESLRKCADEINRLRKALRDFECAYLQHDERTTVGDCHDAGECRCKFEHACLVEHDRPDGYWRPAHLAASPNCDTTEKVDG